MHQCLSSSQHLFSKPPLFVKSQASFLSHIFRLVADDTIIRTMAVMRSYVTFSHNRLQDIDHIQYKKIVHDLMKKLGPKFPVVKLFIDTSF